MSSPSLSPLRQLYKDQTRDRILDAAIELMREQGGEGVLTFAKVAAQAGVTERTVYRHFRTRERLLRAVWPRMQARVGSQGFPTTVEGLLATPQRLFPRFDEQAGLVRASIHSEAGRAVRLSANPVRQAAMLSCVAEAMPGLNTTAQRRRAAIVQLINSALGWSSIKDFWDLDGSEAGRAAAEATAILLGRRDANDAADVDIKEKTS